MSDTSASLSVIVCTYNGSQRLGRVLESLQEQREVDPALVEVILVDNNSTDDTAGLARKLWKLSAPDLRIVFEPKAGLQFARDAGVRAARHELLCWVDDDNVLAPHYLALVTDLMRRFPHAGACGGNGRPVGTSGPMEKPVWISGNRGSHGCGPQGSTEGPVAEDRQFVYGAGMVVRRQALRELELTGFPMLLVGRKGAELSSGEDVELCHALRFLGWQIIHSPRLEFDHLLSPSRFSWEYCARLFYAFGKANVVTGLYFLFLGKKLKYRVRRIWPGFLLSMLRLDHQAGKYRSRPDLSCTPEGIERAAVLGRSEETKRLLADGSLKRYFFAIRDFHRRCAPLRRQREAAIRKMDCAAN
jgi:glycosyltransferase involved in cell wall biosynthesis